MPAVSYEVSATVREDLSEAFESFMTYVHIAEVMATGAFTSATFAKVATGRYRTSYLSATQEDLARYFAEHAPRLRDDVRKHFPDGVEFSREEWSILATF